METNELIGHLRGELSRFAAQGQSNVPVQTLAAYLDSIEKLAAKSMEARRIESANALAQYEAEHRLHRELFRATIDAGKEAINSSIIINGGAVVVLMAFLGNAISKGDQSSLIKTAVTPLLTFGVGVWAGSIAFGARYICQFFYASAWNKSGHFFNAVAWLVTIAALALFGCGVYQTYNGILTVAAK